MWHTHRQHILLFLVDAEAVRLLKQGCGRKRYPQTMVETVNIIYTFLYVFRYLRCSGKYNFMMSRSQERLSQLMHQPRNNIYVLRWHLPKKRGFGGYMIIFIMAHEIFLGFHVIFGFRIIGTICMW